MESASAMNKNPSPAHSPSHHQQLVEQLRKAVHENNLDKVQELINTSGISINCLCLKKSGDSAMHVAARTANGSRILRYLIEEANGNIELSNSDGKTPLHDSAQFNQLESVQLLLEHGANVNALKRADWTPLMLACTKQNSLEIIKTLFKYNADIFFSNKDGWNCFHIACREGSLDIVKYLISYAETICGNDNEASRIRFLFGKSKNGRNPLHTAVMHGHYEICKLLLDQAKLYKIDILLDTDKCGSNPFMESCRFGFLNIIDLLYENYLPYESCLTTTNLNGMNCLCIASEAGQANVIEHLITKYGFDVNVANYINGLTSLHYAVRENQTEAIKILLKLGADTQKSDRKGWTSLEMSKHLKKAESYQILLEFQSKLGNASS